MADVQAEIKNYEELMKKLAAKKKGGKKVMKQLTNEAKTRIPGWVATEVTKEYGVKKGDITGQKIGLVKAKGTNIKKVQIVYTGRLLTPTHFKMAPTAPNPSGAYTLKATIVKGERKTLGKVKKLTKKQKKVLAKNFTRSGTQASPHSPIMLMRANGGHYLPFQRKSQNRNDIEAIKTISLPQMVGSERTAEGIQEAINEGLGKRIEHYMKRYME